MGDIWWTLSLYKRERKSVVLEAIISPAPAHICISTHTHKSMQANKWLQGSIVCVCVCVCANQLMEIEHHTHTHAHTHIRTLTGEDVSEHEVIHMSVGQFERSLASAPIWHTMGGLELVYSISLRASWTTHTQHASVWPPRELIFTTSTH